MDEYTERTIDLARSVHRAGRREEALTILSGHIARLNESDGGQMHPLTSTVAEEIVRIDGPTHRTRLAVTGRFMITGRGLTITGYLLQPDADVVRAGDSFRDLASGATVTIRGIEMVCRPGSPPDHRTPPHSLLITEDVADAVRPGSLLLGATNGQAAPPPSTSAGA